MTTSANYGLGKIGELNEPLNLENFAKYAKVHLNILAFVIQVLQKR